MPLDDAPAGPPDELPADIAPPNPALPHVAPASPPDELPDPGAPPDPELAADGDAPTELAWPAGEVEAPLDPAPWLDAAPGAPPAGSFDDEQADDEQANAKRPIGRMIR